MKPRSTGRRPFKKEESHFVGYNIRAKEVRCINTDGSSEIMPIANALAIAKAQELDLVQLSSSKDDIPTCKIIDYSKFKYELSKKEKASKKKQREGAVKIKEIKFRPSTEDHDLQTKAKHAQDFLNDGHKIKVTIVFKGRELAYKDIAKDTLDKFVGFIDNAIFESFPTLSGRFMSVMIIKKNESITS